MLKRSSVRIHYPRDGRCAVPVEGNDIRFPLTHFSAMTSKPCIHGEFRSTILAGLLLRLLILLRRLNSANTREPGSTKRLDRALVPPSYDS